MEKIEAEKYPLIKDFDFTSEIAGKVGEGVLLIPKKDLYVPKRYGFGELTLITYLQDSFNGGIGLTVGELLKSIDTEGEINLLPDLTSEEELPFLHRVLRKLNNHEIVDHLKIRGKDDEFHLEDVLKKGENYDLTRVYKLIPRSGD